MIVFYLVAVSLVLLAIVVLVWPLYRHRQQTGIDRRQQNIIIARERLAELKTDLASGKLGNEAFEQQRSE
jgi:cytochrome c-type biogenesis protein CcmH